MANWYERCRVGDGDGVRCVAFFLQQRKKKKKKKRWKEKSAWFKGLGLCLVWFCLVGC